MLIAAFQSSIRRRAGAVQPKTRQTVGYEESGRKSHSLSGFEVEDETQRSLQDELTLAVDGRKTRE